MANASILGIILGKLRYKNKPCPIILFKVDKNPKIGLNFAILSLGLAVCLWVEGSRKFLLYIKKIA